jgi:hypothetical protein
MQGAERGVPVGPGHQGGAVADAGAGVHEAGEVVAVQDGAVADEQLGVGLLGVVGAEYCVTSCDLGVFVDQAAEPVPPQDPDT